ncbi:MAG: CRISPR system precrRNA processing endoribonuclease RAMP protein Cas6 [Deltaproteobacteria bacterium]|nr:CRISPR system precrRNA processing endoribonuclease RAMP protein Cas6 [Deltaproteobacteria bacterium]
MLDELAKIRFARLRFQLRAQTPLRLPPYKGSTLRGGFGMSFKDAVCVVAHRDCERCILKTKCAYPYIFETPVPNGSRRLASLEHAPHPFVIEPSLDSQTRYAAGGVLVFVLVLVGRAIDYLPYFIFAFEHLGCDRGIGRAIEAEGESGRAKGRMSGGARGKFTVESVVVLNATGEGALVYDGQSKTLRGDLHPLTIRDVLALTPAASRSVPLTPAASRLSLSFLTPTRLIFDRALATVPEFHILIRNLLRRLSNLAYFHCDGELALDFRGLVDAAEQVKLLENRTRWHDWERYSARQDTKLKMGGVVGEAVYEGELEPFAPVLALGEVLHVGKGTGMGLGRFSLGSPSSLARTTAGEGRGEGTARGLE